MRLCDNSDLTSIFVIYEMCPYLVWLAQLGHEDLLLQLIPDQQVCFEIDALNRAFFQWPLVYLFDCVALQADRSSVTKVYGKVVTRDERLWNVSVRVQSWSDKIESDPVLLFLFFENFWKSSVRSSPDPPV